MLVGIADMPQVGHDPNGDIPFALALRRVVFSVFNHFINGRIDLDIVLTGSGVDATDIAVFILAGQFI